MNSPEIVFTGNVGAAPQLRLAGTTAVTTVRVAVTPRRRPAGSEEWEDGETMWFGVSVWRLAAAHCVASLKPGDRVLVRGRLTQRTWRDAEGVERSSLEVEATEIGLDLTRHPATQLRNRPPDQRRPEDEAAEPAESWAGTADEVTGEVLEPVGNAADG